MGCCSEPWKQQFSVIRGSGVPRIRICVSTMFGPDWDPNTIDWDPNTIDSDPNTIDSDPNTIDSDPNTIDWDPNTIDSDPNY